MINNVRLNYGISQADMYQMYAYSKKYGTEEIWLLYPLNKEMRGHAPISFVCGDISLNTRVRLHFVDLENEERFVESLERLKELVDKEYNQRWAE